MMLINDLQNTVSCNIFEAPEFHYCSYITVQENAAAYILQYLWIQQYKDLLNVCSYI